MAQGQLNGPRKFARATFSCQGRLRGKAPHPDKKMWAWQIFLAHLVGPGPFLASGQLSLVVRGGRDNERFSKFATFKEKVRFEWNWRHLEPKRRRQKDARRKVMQKTSGILLYGQTATRNRPEN